MRGGVVAAPNPVGPRGPLLSSRSFQLPLNLLSRQSASLPRDGLGEDLFDQVQVLHDFVPLPDPAASTHHSGA